MGHTVGQMGDDEAIRLATGLVGNDEVSHAVAPGSCNKLAQQMVTTIHTIDQLDGEMEEIDADR